MLSSSFLSSSLNPVDLTIEASESGGCLWIQPIVDGPVIPEPTRIPLFRTCAFHAGEDNQVPVRPMQS